jgi:hypothetical protein
MASLKIAENNPAVTATAMRANPRQLQYAKSDFDWTYLKAIQTVKIIIKHADAAKITCLSTVGPEASKKVGITVSVMANTVKAPTKTSPAT